jgi:ACR3 family arsenite transporter
MSSFERYLTLWVAACIVVGIASGHYFPEAFQAASARRSRQGQPAGRGADLADDHSDADEDRLRARWRSAAALARHRRDAVRQLGGEAVLDGAARLAVHRLAVPPYLPADQIDSYIAGLILLAAAPCTAMVFVWSQPVPGEPHFTLSQVALNDAIMVVAFAPIVALLLGLSAITVPWDTLLLSVGLYIVVPVIIAQVLRRALLANGGRRGSSRCCALGP